jgi:hypothetical protein
VRSGPVGQRGEEGPERLARPLRRSGDVLLAGAIFAERPEFPLCDVPHSNSPALTFRSFTTWAAWNKERTLTKVNVIAAVGEPGAPRHATQAARESY